MTDSEIERRVLEIEPSAPIEKIAEAMTMAEELKRRATLIVEKCKERMQAWIESNNKVIEWPVDNEGHVRRFYLAEDSTVKCVDPKLAFETLCTLDINDVLCCLSANAWKHGAVKKLLAANGKPELFDQLFRTENRKKVAEDKPVKRIKSIDTRFVESRG